MQQRQGDIFFETISSIPTKGLKKKKDPVIAYGEVTGHSHQVRTPLDKVEMYVDEEGDIFLFSKTEVEITHDEHGPLALPANQYFRISRQREYDPIGEKRERRVRD